MSAGLWLQVLALRIQQVVCLKGSVKLVSLPFADFLGAEEHGLSGWHIIPHVGLAIIVGDAAE